MNLVGAVNDALRITLETDATVRRTLKSRSQLLGLQSPGLLCHMSTR